MDMNKLTQKSQEALQTAQQKAVELGHQQVDPRHLVLGLVEPADGLVRRLLQRMEVPVDAVVGAVAAELRKVPKVSGPGFSPDKIYLTQGEIFSACIAPAAGVSIDLSLWLVSDCADVNGTCVAGDDSGNPECVSYEAAADGWYYLIVDAYSGCGLVDVTIDAPVSNEDASFSNLKTMYR